MFILLIYFIYINLIKHLNNNRCKIQNCKSLHDEIAKLQTQIAKLKSDNTNGSIVNINDNASVDTINNINNNINIIFNIPNISNTSGFINSLNDIKPLLLKAVIDSLNKMENI